MNAVCSRAARRRRLRRGWQSAAAILTGALVTATVAQAQGQSGQSGSDVGAPRRVVEPAGIQITSASTNGVPCTVRRGDKVAVVGSPPASSGDTASAVLDIRMLGGACSGAVGKASAMALSPPG